MPEPTTIPLQFHIPPPQCVADYQWLINSGVVWVLNDGGKTAKEAKRLVDEGLCALGVQATDLPDGPRVPARTEIRTGQPGSAEWVIEQTGSPPQDQ